MKFLALILICATSAAGADERAALYNTWGTKSQCAGDLLKPGGSVRATPFEIRPGWLRQGDMWCRLSWFPSLAQNNGLFAPARALCGEDSVRGFRLDMVLSGDELLLIWDEALVNGPLRRCDGP